MKCFHTVSRRTVVPTVLAALALLVLVAPPAAAQGCPAYICYLDLVQGAAICPNGSVYQVTALGDVATTDPDCPATVKAAVVEVTVPAACSGFATTIEYGGAPRGHTVDIGDSVTDNGYGGDAGSLPAGQNAEVHVVNDQLLVYNAADNPMDVETLATANLALEDGALRVVVGNQSVSWSQPYTALETPDLERLFFLPDNPVAPENRTVYVALNRVIADTSRTGCGVRHALIFTQ
jgi:hypothetical protein